MKLAGGSGVKAWNYRHPFTHLHFELCTPEVHPRPPLSCPWLGGLTCWDCTEGLTCLLPSLCMWPVGVSAENWGGGGEGGEGAFASDSLLRSFVELPQQISFPGADDQPSPPSGAGITTPSALLQPCALH